MKHLVMVFMLLSVSVMAFADNAPSFKYGDVVQDKHWVVNQEHSETRAPGMEVGYEVSHLPNMNDGNIYRRDAYIRGVKIGKPKFIRVVDNPNDEKDNYDYLIYDKRTDELVSKVRLGEDGRLYELMSSGDMLAFEVQTEKSECNPYESKMDCLLRTNPEEYMKQQKESWKNK